MTIQCDLSLTETALNHIKNYLQNKSLYALRIRIEQVGCSGLQYVIDELKSDNEIKPSDIAKHFSFNVTVYVDEESVKYLNGLCIDFGKAKGDENNPLKPAKLIFINPNEKGACGCGESFSV